MTSLVERLFTRTVTVQRPTPVSTGYGGSTQTLATIATSKAALQPRSAREQLSAAREDLLYDHMLYLPIGTNIARGDRFTADGDSRTYRVVAVKDASGVGHHLEVPALLEISL